MKYCFPDNTASAAKTLVYIPGKSFMALTGPSGEFNLYYIPGDVTEVAIEGLSGTMHTVAGIQVQTGTTTALGTLTICCDGGLTPDCLCPDGANKSENSCAFPYCTPEDLQSFDTCVSNCSGNLLCASSCPSSASTACAADLSALYTCAYPKGCVNAAFALDAQCATLNCPEQYRAVFDPSSGACTDGETRPCGPENVGICRSGSQTCINGQWQQECVGAVYPGEELCNGMDDNCNGTVDEVGSNYYYPDADGDGYGDAGSGMMACTLPAGYTLVGGDCDDTNFAIHRGAAEICNGDDDNCDGMIDEDGATGCTIYSQDADNDGYGSTTSTVCACTQPAGYVITGGDCGDTDPTRNPESVELCNGVDDNCNGVTDESFPEAGMMCNEDPNFPGWWVCAGGSITCIIW